jgi:DNA recombination protein RmuC
MEYFVAFVVGVIVGAGIALVAGVVRARAAKGQMREAFASLASEALDTNSRRLTEMTGAALDGKKELIDRSVTAVNERLEQVRSFLQRIEAERKQDFGRLTSSVSSLSLTAGKLHEMLASTQRRGAWGERMTEDILRLVGMQEGVNYVKQSSQDAESGRPDFTFLLPSDLKANMDVKFPLESYRAYLDATDDDARAGSLRQLVVAVRGHIRAVASRGYIDPKVPTVPYVIVFLASEQLFSLVLAAEPDLIDEALHRRVVLAGPLTLYAMLSVMRQAAENANLMRTADEVISLLGQFHKQWNNYNQELDKLGDRIEAAVRQFDTVRTTRTNQLQKPLDKIEELRTTRALPDEDGA